MRSLLAPLVIGLVVSLALVFGVQWSAVRSALDVGVRNFIAEQLNQDADELKTALIVSADGRAALGIQHFDPVFLTEGSGRYFEVLVDGAVAARSPSLGQLTLPVAPVPGGQRMLGIVAGPHGQQVLVSSSGFAIDQRTVTIAVAADLEPIERESSKLLGDYTRVSVLMFALLLVLQVLIVRRALRPLRRLQGEVARLEHGDLTQLPAEVPVEVLPLVREINELLALLAQRLQRSREALGDLAHALKGPLTILTHIAQDERLREHPQLAAQLDGELQSLRRRIDAELRRARVAGGRTPGPVLALAEEIGTLAGTLRKLYGERGLEIETQVDPTIGFRGDREDLLELCGNLLDNACKWARGRVRVSAHRDHGIVLRVEDDGPGCSETDLETIALRGVRLDESVEGHGLGLSIVRNIAVSYGARLEFGRSAELGGFQASVTFPAK